MKKIFLNLLIITSLVKAEDMPLKTFQHIFEGIFPNKKEILVYNIGTPKYNLKNIKYTTELYKSDIIHISESYRLKITNDKPIFASSLIQLNFYKNAIGAYYIKDGKPHIVFVRERLKEHNLKFAEYLEKYIIYEEIYTF